MNLYQLSENLYARYPEAVRPVTGAGSVRSMILMTGQQRGTEQFFVLTRQRGRGGPSCTLFQWGGDGLVVTTPDGTVIQQDILTVAAAERITQAATPLPPGGSMYGWAHQRDIAAIMPFYAGDGEKPSFSVMPRADAPRDQWPPFASAPLFGQWFWDHHKAGRIVDVGTHVARTCRTVWWADTKASLGWDSCAVAQDVKLPRGITLPHGLYAYYQALQNGAQVPGLESLLASRGKTDLGPRFAQAA